MTEERSICYENECTGLVDKNANGKRNIYITMTLGTDLNCFLQKILNGKNVHQQRGRG
jgi:hypothetical protein